MNRKDIDLNIVRFEHSSPDDYLPGDPPSGWPGGNPGGKPGNKKYGKSRGDCDIHKTCKRSTRFGFPLLSTAVIPCAIPVLSDHLRSSSIV